MISKSIQGNSTEEIKTALEQNMADGFKPTLAIVFISVKQDRKVLSEILTQEGIAILGATSCGEFIEGHPSEGGIAMLLMDMNPAYFTILFAPVGDTNLQEVSIELAKKALQQFKRPAFILCTTSFLENGDMLDGECVVRSLEEVVGQQVSICGGMAGDDWQLSKSYIFTHEHEASNGMAALILDEDHIQVEGMAISGWKPIGIKRTITRSVGTTIYTIDDKPALEMYLKYLGETYDDGKGKYDLFEEISLYYPFLVDRESRTAMMVTPMSVNKSENALVCDVPVEQGSKLQFTMPPDFDFVDQVLEKANELKNSTQTKAEALLIFSCAGRVSALGPLANHENEGLADVWKVPMAGFYTYGEYGRSLNERQEFHSTTNSWVVLKEK
jgi:hypothetical protein